MSITDTAKKLMDILGSKSGKREMAILAFGLLATIIIHAAFTAPVEKMEALTSLIGTIIHPTYLFVGTCVGIHVFGPKKEKADTPPSPDL